MFTAAIRIDRLLEGEIGGFITTDDGFDKLGDDRRRELGSLVQLGPTVIKILARGIEISRRWRDGGAATFGASRTLARIRHTFTS